MISVGLQKAFDTIIKFYLKNSTSWASLKDELHGFSHIFPRNNFYKYRKPYFEYGRISPDVPQGKILEPLLFLIYVSDMPLVVNWNLLLYADDSSLKFQHRDVEEIEMVLNNDFKNICDWFVDNKLTIHYSEDKTKSVLFASKCKIKNKKYQDIEINQHSQLTSI